MIPELQRLPPGETFRVLSGGESYWGIDEYDVAVQGLISHHLEIVGDRVERGRLPGARAAGSRFRSVTRGPRSTT
jgi:hypothetical protein